MVMKMATTAATIRNNIHTTVINLLKNDSTVGTKNFYDGNPYDATSAGFPYIIVRTPSIIPLRKSLSNKLKRTALLQISVVSQKEGLVRQLADAVANSLETNQDITRAQNMYWCLVDSSSPIPSSLPTEDPNKSTRIWTITLNVEYTTMVS